MPVRNPYERGTAGPPFRGVLPHGNRDRTRGKVPRGKKDHAYTRFLSVAARNTQLTERGRWPEHRVRRASDAGLVPSGSLCYDGGLAAAGLREPPTPPLPAQEHDMSKKEEQANEESTPKLSQSEQLRKYKGGYETYATATGLSMDNGDPIALALRGSSPETVMRAAEKLQGLEPSALATKYANLNPGAKRMNAGNQIRGFERRGDKTVAEIIKVLKQANAEINAVTA